MKDVLYVQDLVLDSVLLPVLVIVRDVPLI